MNVSHRFRFKNLWLREEEFMSSFEMWWGSSVDLSLVSRLSHCAGFMANWGFVINLKTVRCGLSNSGLLLMKVELLNFLMRKGVLPSC